MRKFYGVGILDILSREILVLKSVIVLVKKNSMTFIFKESAIV